jgi:hypothetical protein
MRFAGRHPFVPRQVTLAWPGLLPRVLIAGTGPVTDQLSVREIDYDEGRRRGSPRRQRRACRGSPEERAGAVIPARPRPLSGHRRAEHLDGDHTLDCEEPLNRIEAQFTALRYFTLDGTDHPSHKEQASMIRRYIIWRNNHTYDQRLHRIVDRANVA